MIDWWQTASAAFGLGMLAGGGLVVAAMAVLASRDKLTARVEAMLMILEHRADGVIYCNPPCRGLEEDSLYRRTKADNARLASENAALKARIAELEDWVRTFICMEHKDADADPSCAYESCERGRLILSAALTPTSSDDDAGG